MPHVDDLLLAERLVRAAPPPPPPPLPGVEPASSIAFLFLAKDKLDYMEGWQRFFHGAEPAHYGIYFHFFDTRYLSSLPQSCPRGCFLTWPPHVRTLPVVTPEQRLVEPLWKVLQAQESRLSLSPPCQRVGVS